MKCYRFRGSYLFLRKQTEEPSQRADGREGGPVLCSKPPRKTGSGRADGRLRWAGRGGGAVVASALSLRSIYEEGSVSCTLGLRSPKPCPAFLLGRWRWPPGPTPHLPIGAPGWHPQWPVPGHWCTRVLPPPGRTDGQRSSVQPGPHWSWRWDQGLVKNGDPGWSMPPANQQGETSGMTETTPQICAPSHEDTSKTRQKESVRKSVC